jgi:hypothetical protein
MNGKEENPKPPSLCELQRLFQIHPLSLAFGLHGMYRTELQVHRCHQYVCVNVNEPELKVQLRCPSVDFSSNGTKVDPNPLSLNRTQKALNAESQLVRNHQKMMIYLIVLMKTILRGPKFLKPVPL